MVADRRRRLELSERLSHGEQRLAEIRDQRQRLRERLVDEETVMDALTQFDEVWGTYCIMEKSRILKLLIEKIEYDGEASTVSVTYRPTGFREFTEELEGRDEG